MRVKSGQGRILLIGAHDDFTTISGYAWPTSFKGQGIGSCQAKNNGAKQMSPNVGNFVHDLVEMAKAMETLPQVQEALRQAEETHGKLVETINSMGADLEQSRNYAASLEQKVRSLEVERDDASFRVLEAEDQNHAILSVARVAQANLSVILATLDPPKPEPEKEPEQVALTEDQRVPDPTTVAAAPVTESGSVSATATQSENASTSTTIPEAVHSISELPGQSESSPTQETVSASSPSQENVPTQATSTDVENSERATSAEPLNGPYFGKRYDVDVSGWISYGDWIEGGGTYDNYYARRS